MLNNNKKTQRLRQGRAAIAALTAIVVLGGCAAAKDWIPGRNTETVSTLSVEDSELSLYLRTMNQLVTADTDNQRKLFATLERKAERSPTTTNRLVLALAEVTAGHPGTNLTKGRSALQSLIAEPGLLVETERQLVTVFLNELTQYERMSGTAESRANSELRAAQQERDQLARQLATEKANNAQLQNQLKEAEDKLNAITRIERSLRERSDDAPTQ